MWTPSDLEWAGGYLEGEGCFAVQLRESTHLNPPLRISATSTDEDAILKLHSRVKLGRVSGPLQKKGHPNWKPQWTWQVCVREEVYALAVAIYPFLCARRQAKVRLIVATFVAIAPRQEVVHGTNSMYAMKCRCAPCTEAHSNAGRDYYRRKKAGLTPVAP